MTMGIYECACGRTIDLGGMAPGSVLLKHKRTKRHQAMAQKVCFACGKRLYSGYRLVKCEDDQTAFVGPVCYQRIKKSGNTGWVPSLGGPRLFILEAKGDK